MAKRKSAALALRASKSPELVPISNQDKRAERFQFLDIFPLTVADLERYMLMCATRMAIYDSIKQRQPGSFVELPPYSNTDFYTRLLGGKKSPRVSSDSAFEIPLVLKETTKFQADVVSQAVGSAYQIVNNKMSEGPRKTALIHFLSSLCLIIVTLRRNPGPHYKKMKQGLAGSDKLHHLALLQHILVLLIELDRQSEVLSVKKNTKQAFHHEQSLMVNEDVLAIQRLELEIHLLRLRLLRLCQVCEELALNSQYPKSNPVNSAILDSAASIDAHRKAERERLDSDEIGCPDIFGELAASNSPDSCVRIADGGDYTTPLSMAVGERLEEVLDKDDEDGGSRNKR